MPANSAISFKCLSSGVYAVEQIFDACHPGIFWFSSRYSSFAAIAVELVASWLLCGSRWCHSEAPISFMQTGIEIGSLSLRRLYRFGWVECRGHHLSGSPAHDRPLSSVSFTRTCQWRCALFAFDGQPSSSLCFSFVVRQYCCCKIYRWVRWPAAPSGQWSNSKVCSCFATAPHWGTCPGWLSYCP